MTENRTPVRYPRHAAARAQVILSDTPVLGIIGPRQSGKTTLARGIGGGRRFISLDNAATRAAALADPISVIRDVDSAIIDEIQHAPELMLSIKETVDSNRRPGRFIVTGSANILTIQKMQESLAGRIELLTLLPLSQDELEDNGPAHFLDRLFAGDRFLDAGRDRALTGRVLTGGYPDAIARQDERRRDWFAACMESMSTVFRVRAGPSAPNVAASGARRQAGGTERVIIPAQLPGALRGEFPQKG